MRKLAKEVGSMRRRQAQFYEAVESFLLGMIAARAADVAREGGDPAAMLAAAAAPPAHRDPLDPSPYR